MFHLLFLLLSPLILIILISLLILLSLLVLFLFLILLLLFKVLMLATLLVALLFFTFLNRFWSLFWGLVIFLRRFVLFELIVRPEDVFEAVVVQLIPYLLESESREGVI